jgi:tRNA A37 threonylcarbamoyltransferase TsaD
MILGIESTAHTFGVAVVENGKVLSKNRKVYI